MARDAEEYVIAYTMLLLAGVTAVGLSGWVLTAAPATAVAPFILGSMAVVVLSISAGPIAMALGDRLDRDWPVTVRKVTLVLIAGIVVEAGSFLLVGPDGAVIVVATIVALVAVWAVVPLSIGAISATTGGTSMLSVLVAWPLSNLLALVVFVAPSPTQGVDFGRYNALVLDEPARSAVVLAIVAIVAFGPTMLGKVIDRWVDRGLSGSG